MTKSDEGDRTLTLVLVGLVRLGSAKRGSSAVQPRIAYTLKPQIFARQPTPMIPPQHTLQLGLDIKASHISNGWLNLLFVDAVTENFAKILTYAVKFMRSELCARVENTGVGPKPFFEGMEVNTD